MQIFNKKVSAFKNLEYEKLKLGRGNKITHIKFTFTKEENNNKESE